jgi:hypothetical protein
VSLKVSLPDKSAASANMQLRRALRRTRDGRPLCRFRRCRTGCVLSSPLFVAIGVSGAVYPAAGFVAQAGALGIATCEINLEPSDNAELFDERRYGKASEVVPAWVEEVLAGRPDERTIPRGAKLRPQL